MTVIARGMSGGDLLSRGMGQSGLLVAVWRGMIRLVSKISLVRNLISRI